MSARAEIENTLNSWGRATDTRDIELKRSVLTEDTHHRVDLPGAEPIIIHGREAVLANFLKNWASYPESGLKHLFSNLVVYDETDETAKAVSYMTAIRPLNGEPVISSSATFYDELRKVEGKWLIARHYNHVEFKPGGLYSPRADARQ